MALKGETDERERNILQYRQITHVNKDDLEN